MKIKEKLEFITFILYRYYSKGPQAMIAYQSALLAWTLVIYINILTLLTFFNVELSKYFPLIKTKGRLIEMLNNLLYMLPIYFLFAFVVREKELVKKKYSPDKIEKGKSIIFMYFVISIGTFFLGLLMFRR